MGMIELEDSFFKTFHMAPEEEDDPYYDMDQGFKRRGKRSD